MTFPIVQARCPECGNKFLAAAGCVTACPRCDETLHVPSNSAKPASAQSAGRTSTGAEPFANPPTRGGDN